MMSKSAGIALLALMVALSGCKTSTSGYGRVGVKTGAISPAEFQESLPRRDSEKRLAGVMPDTALTKGRNANV